MLRSPLLLALLLAGTLVLVIGDPRKGKGFQPRRRSRCRYHCPARVGSEVCGSDGKTYNSHCEFKAASCKSTAWIQVVHRGKCQEPSTQTKQMKCQNFCAKIYRPVCGSDGRTYGNLCMLNATSCRHGNQITKTHDGRCGATKRCVPHRCQRLRKPVCGTDGKTYSNECTLKVIACRSKQDIKVAHQGHCTERCQIRPCRKNIAYMCGSDGKTYNNLCLLKNEACSSRQKITVAHRGKCSEHSLGCIKACDKSRRPVCGSDDVTYGNECLFQIAVCMSAKQGKVLTKTKDTECNSPDKCRQKPCSRKMRPVCGNDGKTYANECVLKNIACRKGKEIIAAHLGRCTKKCQIRPCLKIFRPVCGSDGKTYSNLCLMKNEACSSRVEIRLVAEKPCEDLPCTPKPCPKIRRPVCGSDGKTYSNKCTLENKACTSETTLTVASEGRCKSTEANKCRQRCPNFHAPRCGSDGKTYKNLCFMRQAACLQGKRIRVSLSSTCSS